MVIIPGPKPPNTLAPYLVPLLDEFQKFGSKGWSVKCIDEEPYLHRPFLLGVLADSPARCKLTRWNGVGAYIACGWCLFQGCQYPTSGGRGGTHIYYKGYKEPVLHNMSDSTATK